MTTIGIIGAGHVGESIAKAAIANGYDVILSNTADPESLAGLVEKLGPHASAATPADTAARCDFAVVAIPITTIDQVPVEPLAGKVVLTTINYFPDRLGHIAAIDDHTTTAPGLLQAHLPTSKVVRAFSMIDAADMSGDGHPKGDPKRRALALAGDDPEAKKLVAGLYDQFGFDTVDLGALDQSWRVDAGQKAFVTHQNVAQLEENVANAERP
ncbi:MAG TPA: NAD(P)-binding domain-containing protein [Acidimicrobiales bacterium]|nr:NAD(P)-binding domain-containing protein [Acidimicrobiales bacterium]